MGDRAFVALSCPRDDGSTVVRAWLEGGDWTWESSNVYEEPDFENEILYHRFEHVGALSSGEHVLAHFHHDCELENCDRTDILFISPDGTVAVIVAETQAGRVSISPSGDLEYQEKTAYSAGYHVASAEFTYRWDGSAFERQPDPVLRAEYDTWPCPDSEVVPVDRSNGEPAGEPIPVQRGGTIEVLDADSGHPGELFEYRVGEQRFWAKGWMQTCAG